MQNYSKKLFKILSTALVALIFATGCDNDPSAFGLDTLPPKDLLQAHISKQDISSENYLPERIRTDSDQRWRQARGILGYYNDPVMGFTRADIVTGITLGMAIDSFKRRHAGKIFPDSLILKIAYNYGNWIGDENEELTIQVFELTEPLLTAGRQYHNEPIEGKFLPEPLGEVNVTADANLDEDSWTAQNNVHQLKIPLSREFTDRLMELPDSLLSDRAKFNRYFPGFYITVSEPENVNSTGSLLRLAMFGAEDGTGQIILESNLTLHYRHELYEEDEEGEVDHDSPLQTDRYSHIFPIYTETRFFNRFQHQHPDNIHFNDQTTDRLYIQGMAGTQGKINIDELIWAWSDSLNINQTGQNKVGISNAELIFYPDSVLMNSFQMNYPMLTIVQKNADDKFVPPVYKSGEIEYRIFSDASYYALENRYLFRIDRSYFERMAREQIELDQLYLVSHDLPAFNFSRIVLHNNHPEFHPVLRVKYVKHP